MKILTLVLSAALITGCATSTPKVTEYEFPANLTTPCDELPRLRAGSLANLYKYTLEIATLYNQCAMRHDALSEAVKKIN